MWAAAARDAARLRGLRVTDLQPLRVHACGIFLVRPDDIVARVAPRTPTDEARARRSTATTHALAATGFGCTRPLWAEPTLLDSAVVSFWQYYPQPADPQTLPSPQLLQTLVEALADLLHELHAWTGPLPDLQPAQPLARILAAMKMDDARATPTLLPRERDYLTARIDETQAAWENIESVLGWGLIHNDAHRGNLLLADTSPTGFVLADWDSVCLGPREIDLVHSSAPGGKFTLPETQRLTFARRYGFDLADWPGHTVLREIRELHSLAAHLRLAPTKPASATELHARLDDLLGRQPHIWRPVR
jgi:hypothetical protein